MSCANIQVEEHTHLEAHAPKSAIIRYICTYCFVGDKCGHIGTQETDQRDIRETLHVRLLGVVHVDVRCYFSLKENEIIY